MSNFIIQQNQSSKLQAMEKEKDKLEGIDNLIKKEDLTERELSEKGVFKWDLHEIGVSKYPFKFWCETFAYFTEGEVIVKIKQGSVVLKKGDYVTFREGLESDWDVTLPIKKHVFFTKPQSKLIQNLIKIEHPSEAELRDKGVYDWSLHQIPVSQYPFHFWCDTYAYFKEGEVAVRIEQATVTLKKGDFVTFREGIKSHWNVSIPLKKHVCFTKPLPSKGIANLIKIESDLPEKDIIKEGKHYLEWDLHEIPVSNYPFEFTMGKTYAYFIEGHCKVTIPEGQVEIKKGDFVTFTDGMKSQWEVLLPLKKYVLFTEKEKKDMELNY